MEADRWKQIQELYKAAIRNAAELMLVEGFR
jgi:hypothetical protein